MIKSKGFGLISVIIIMIITSIVSGITTGVIMLNNNDIQMNNYSDDKDLKEFIEVYEVLLSKYYDSIDKKGMLEAAENGMLDFLGDKYTTYLESDEYQEIVDELAKTYMGIGIEIEGRKIVSFIENSPALKSGMMVGDYLTKINGINVENLNSEQIGLLIKNDKSEYVDIEVLRNNNLLSFRIKKEKLINKVINYHLLDNTSIGYLYIKNFAENLDEQVNNALKELESNGMTSLIIDLRGNGGGYLQAAEKTSSLFLEEGKIIYSLKSNSQEVTYKDKTKEKKSYPIMILIDNNTASAAEILAAALKESYNATIVGTKSYGKGKVQEVIKLENGDSVKTTSAKWYTPNGICIDGLGITPDYYEAYSNYGIYNDTQLAKAVELLTT